MPKDVPDWTTGTDIPWVKVGSHTLTQVGADSFHTTAVLPATRMLGIFLEGGANILTNLGVQGDQSGTVYALGAVTSSAQQWILVRINGALDTTYVIFWSSSVSANAVVGAFTSVTEAGFPNLGQQQMSFSLPVVIASDQVAIPVTSSGTSDVDANIDEWGGVATSLGQKVAASSLPVVLASDQVIGKSGQAAMAASAPVVIASDQSAIPVTTSLANAAPWQVPNLAPTLLIVNFVGGDAHDLIAAVAGKVILLFGLWVEFSAVPGIWTLRDGATTVFEGVGSTVGPFPIPGSGAQVASSGNAFRMFCTNAVTVRGWVLASQV